MVGMHGETLSSTVVSVFDRCLVSDSSAKTAYSYWQSLWEKTWCSVIDDKLQLKHASAAKQW